MSLTPKDESGRLAFTIGLGAQVQTITGPEPLTPGRWTHVAVALTGDTGVLYVDGKEVARSDSMTLNPDMLHGHNLQSGAFAAYLGRDPRGRHFAGMLDDVRIYGFPQSETLIASLAAKAGNRTAAPPAVMVADRTPPTPGKPEFLTAPVALDGNAVKMSVARGKDDSGWVEYFYQCTSGGGHDSGWISASQYTDCLLEPGRTYTYTVKMRDRHGNETAASAPMSVRTPAIRSNLEPARFAEAPRGISDTAIRMRAAIVKGEHVEYQFRCVHAGHACKGSGWQSSPNWTATGLEPGSGHVYQLQVRDGHRGAHGTTGKMTVARDDTPPARFRLGEWQTYPYSTVDNRISLKARAVTGGFENPARIESDPVEYSFECVTGGGPDSGWIKEPHWVTPPLPDGTYVYRFRMRDTSPQRNVSGYSSAETAAISNMTGYHGYRVSQLSRLPEGALVTIKGTLTAVEKDHYVVESDGASVKVMPRTVATATDPALLGKAVTVNGCLWGVSGEQRITWAGIE